jgi:allatostatin receptor
MDLNVTEEFEDEIRFEKHMSILVVITFGLTFFLGLIGNTLVFFTILLNKKMRNTTNILILNLAIAELIFIILCVPTTGFNYILR